MNDNGEPKRRKQNLTGYGRPEIREQLEKWAAAEKRSIAFYVVEAVEEYVERRLRRQQRTARRATP